MAMVDCKEGRASVFVFLLHRWLSWLQSAILCYGGARPLFIGVAEVATRGGAWCITARVSMDSVHGSKDGAHGRKATVHKGRPAVAVEDRGGCPR